jgi:hypothetical protein
MSKKGYTKLVYRIGSQLYECVLCSQFIVNTTLKYSRSTMVFDNDSASDAGASDSSCSHYDHSTRSGSSFSLARSETRAVNRSKLIVLGVIALAACAVAFFTYWFVSQGEEHAFELAVSSYSRSSVGLVVEIGANPFIIYSFTTLPSR